MRNSLPANQLRAETQVPKSRNSASFKLSKNCRHALMPIPVYPNHWPNFSNILWAIMIEPTALAAGNSALEGSAVRTQSSSSFVSPLPCREWLGEGRCVGRPAHRSAQRNPRVAERCADWRQRRSADTFDGAIAPQPPSSCASAISIVLGGESYRRSQWCAACPIRCQTLGCLYLLQIAERSMAPSGPSLPVTSIASMSRRFALGRPAYGTEVYASN